MTSTKGCRYLALSTIYFIWLTLAAISTANAECPPGEEFLQGGPVCEGCEFRCDLLAEIHKCYCKSGYCRRSENSSCTLKTKSRRDVMICPINEVHSDCVVPCNDCYTKGQCAFLVCNKGCDCIKGFYRNDAGSCIPAALCPKA